MLLFTAIILPATITSRPVENKANYLHESVQVIILILQLALGQRWLSINESVQTMDSQQKMINHKRPTLKNKANFNRAVTSEKRTKKFHIDDASLS